ncbi:hypothetical protein CRM22_007940 [Opisthorchis felineus]|uniref:Uncharacterized protein n=1 Tax=Opisthorchis felineus TaxID=147828 RepID=A0A4S2LDW6_OPIFE|nr:hypothetical protein CRM22_007940 [Opisthorchis felineus]
MSYKTHAFRLDTDWKELARQLYEQVSPDFLQEQLRTFAGGQPHPPGTIANRVLGERIASDWESWHIPIVRREEFFVTLPLGPSPSGPLNEVILTDAAGSKVIFEAKNYVSTPSGQTTPVSNLSHSEGNSAEATYGNSDSLSILPIYHAYSTNGSVTGRFVFLNYCRPQDLVAFDKTQGRQKGQPSLLCSGKLTAIARLQKTTRQSKIRALFTHCDCGSDGSPVPGHHPSALVLYPDPQDTVSPHHPIYPDGPGLPGDSPVFGHLCMSHGGGGNPGAPHLPSSIHTYETHEMTPGKALTSIPVQPISYNDAAVILSHLSGPELPEEWSGCLATHLGPSHDSVTPPGTGSDHIPFSYKLGVPSSYPGFTPDDGLAYPPIYHTAYDVISVAERFTDPAVSDTGPMPRHRLLVRLYLTMILQLCCASRLPYSICRWAMTFSKEWAKFKQFAVSKVPKLASFGVNLDWISEDLDQMLHSAERVEAFLNTLEHRTTEFPAVLNRTVANIPKCFVKPSLSDPDLFPFVLYAPRGFQTVYFHRVQSVFTRFLKHIHDHNSEEKLNCLRLLKQELSILASCINQATECMRNGLVGFEGLA